MQQCQPQQQKVPGRIQIGTFSKKQKFLSDESQLSKEGGLHKINAIKVLFDKKGVLALQMYYKLADGDYLKASHNVPPEKKLLKKSKQIQQRVFEIGPDDYLLEISGHQNKDRITRLTFTSYRGKIGNYGIDEGQPFKIKFDHHTFGAFNSGFSEKKGIEYLDIPVLPVPQQFLNEFKPITVNVNVSGQEQRQSKQQGKKTKQVDNTFVAPSGSNPNAPPIFAGAYVAPVAQGSNPTYGSVRGFKMPTVGVPAQPIQQQPMYAPQQQAPVYAPPQYQQQQQQQFQQPQYQQPQPQQNNNQSGNNNIGSSNYPTF